MPIMAYTTSIAAETSADEIRALLSKIGASVSITYGADQRPKAMSFEIAVPGGAPMHFQLPARVDGVHQALIKDWNEGRLTSGQATRAHATDVAWRILKNWTEVQVAIIQSSMVAPQEVFMPYALTNEGVTFYESFVSQRALGPGRTT